jgi:hypothetical protein
MQRDRASGRQLSRRLRAPADAGPRRLHGSADDPVDAVGNLKDVIVCGEALRLEALEQRGAAAAAPLQRELPSDVVGVLEAGVQALTAERARQVAGVA